MTLAHMNVVVSIDGLQPEHDVRRAPATYDRVLEKHRGPEGHDPLHCHRSNDEASQCYLEEISGVLDTQGRGPWARCGSACSLQQIGDRLPEMLQPDERLHAIADMLALRKEFSKLDMPEGMEFRQFATPPRSPKDCVFALTTRTLSADLKTKIVPCQFGGNPDCHSCGLRIASMGLAAIAAHKWGGIIPVGAVFKASVRIGQIGRTRSEPTAALPAVEKGLRVHS